MRKIKSIATAAAVFMSISAYADDLKVAVYSANVPFGYEDQNGKLTGYEVDIINLVAQRLGKKVDYASTPFHMLFSAVQSGRADLAIGTVTITPKRLESISFSQPWIDSELCLTVASKSGIDKVDGLAGKGVAAVTGSVGEIWASTNQEKYKFSEIRRYDGSVEAFLDVASGRVGGVFHDCPSDAYYIKDKPQYKIVEHIPTNEQFAPIFKKDSSLIAEVNEQLTKLKEEGEIDKIHQKWFGQSAPDDSSTKKVFLIPKG